MAALPYMALWVPDYLADTQHLGALEHGAYLLLIMAYWQRGEALPDDDRRLAMTARATGEEWAQIRPVLAEFFEIGGGLWRHRRVEKELAAARDKSGKARAAAQARHGGARHGGARHGGARQDGAAAGKGKAAPAGRTRSGRSAPAYADAGAHAGADAHADADADAVRTQVRTQCSLSPSLGNPLLPSGGPPPEQASGLHDGEGVPDLALPDLALSGDGPMDMQIQLALERWNGLAEELKLSTAKHVAGARRAKLRRRLQEHGLAGWDRALAEVRASSFLRGRNERGWRCGFDFLLSEESFAKVVEGQFADPPPEDGTGPPAPRRLTEADRTAIWEKVYGDAGRDGGGCAGTDPGPDDADVEGDRVERRPGNRPAAVPADAGRQVRPGGAVRRLGEALGQPPARHLAGDP